MRLQLALAAMFVLATSDMVRAQEAPTTKPSQPQQRPREYSNGAKELAKNYVRPGWRLVDGLWVKPQGKYALTELIRFVEEDGRHKLSAQPSDRVEPLLRNWRTSLVELDGSDYGWKLSARGRTWNDTRSGGTQHLQLVCVLDDAVADQTYRLTKISIKPEQQVVQAVVAENDEPMSVIIVFGRDFTEAAISRFNARRARTIMRSGTARQLLLDHPIEARQYVVPALRLLNKGLNPLAPAAGDVYRAFADLPVDETLQETIRKLSPDLAAPDPAIRERASRELESLGRRGVQAAMRIDTSKLPLEAADRIGVFIQQNTVDPRDDGALRADSAFLLDCLVDPDPNVQAAAGKIIQRK